MVPILFAGFSASVLIVVVGFTGITPRARPLAAARADTLVAAAAFARDDAEAVTLAVAGPVADARVRHAASSGAFSPCAA
jgi:hypothetical protein